MHANDNNRIDTITPEIQAHVDDCIRKNVASLKADMLQAVQEHPAEMREVFERFQELK